VIPVARQVRHPTGVRKPAALARFRIAAQALYRFKARPVTSVPSELNALEAGGDNVAVQYLLEQVMYLHFVRRRTRALHD
jgi:hypothetical protein